MCARTLAWLSYWDLKIFSRCFRFPSKTIFARFFWTYGRELYDFFSICGWPPPRTWTPVFTQGTTQTHKKVHAPFGWCCHTPHARCFQISRENKFCAFFVWTRGHGLGDFFGLWWCHALYDPIFQRRRCVRAMSVAPPFASRYHHEKRASVRREASLVARSGTCFEVVGQA